jgi:hypothetical protein
MIHILNPKNNNAVTRLQEGTTPAGADLFSYETAAGAKRRITFTNLATSVLASIVNTIIPTGVMVPWLSSSAPTGWILASGLTVGSAASAATGRANADTASLYTVLWNSFTNTELVIQDSTGTPTTRGASAADDFAANKRLPLPDLRDRTIVGLANMGGTDAARIGTFDTAVIGKSGGSDTITLTEGQLPAHTHDVSVPTVLAGVGEAGATHDVYDANTDVTSSSVGSGDPVAIVQPSIAIPYIIKL